ncbi:MAG: putative sulfate exporter family transporter [Actinomycetales bacterium]|nr:putative sulfate exporter family transporter [Actinomycetales bacterium]
MTPETPPGDPSPAGDHAPRRAGAIVGALPGLAAAGAGAAVAWVVHQLVPAVPWLTAALVLGVIAGSIPPLRPALEGVLRPGLGVAARRLLRLGIVVLGLGLSLSDIARLGWVAILAIVALVAASFAITWGLARLLRLPGDEPVLLAAGFSICGVSAIGAMSAARRSPEQDSAAPTTLVTLYGTAAIVVLPALAALLGLDAAQFGHWVGASVHDVGQVVATAQTAGAAALAVAVVVKLTRVLLLAPMVAIASIGTRRADRRARAAEGDAAPAGPRVPIVPLFILGFAALVLVRTLLPVPAAVLEAAGFVQSALLATALAAIGASLRLERLVRSGPRALAVGALSWIAILALALPMALWL